MAKRKKLKTNLLFTLILLVTSVYLVYGIILYQGIENDIRYLIIGIIIILNILYTIRCLKNNKLQYLKRILGVVLSALFIFGGYQLNHIYNSISYTSKAGMEASAIVALSSNKVKNEKEIKNSLIGVLEKTDDDDLNHEIIKDLDKSNKQKDFGSQNELIKALIKKDVHYISVPVNYLDLFSEINNEENLNLKETTKIVHIKERKIKRVKKVSKDINEPFTMLLFGTDATGDSLKNSKTFRSDSIMVVTFNPKTFSANMLSIPRDSFIPISCKGGKRDKITHAGIGGVDCLEKSISNLLDVNIDYYVKLNFKGLVDLVDAVGGVEVEVDYPFCEQDSKRRKDPKHLIYVDKGKQTLNGEQALALSRKRKNNHVFCKAPYNNPGPLSDFVRAANQQKVAKGLVNKIKDIDKLSDFEKILKILSNNMETNMSTTTIFSFYDILKELAINLDGQKDVININTLKFSSRAGTFQNPDIPSQELSYVVLSKTSLEVIKKAMKENLSSNPSLSNREFYYNPTNPYIKKIIGEGYGDFETFERKKIKNFVGLSKDEAINELNKLKMKYSFVEKCSEKAEGTILTQSIAAGSVYKRVQSNTMILSVSSKNKCKEQAEIEEPIEICAEDDTTPQCVLPEFMGKTVASVNQWKNSLKYKIYIKFVPQVEEEELKNDSKIISQDTLSGTKLKEIDGLTISFTYKNND